MFKFVKLSFINPCWQLEILIFNSNYKTSWFITFCIMIRPFVYSGKFFEIFRIWGKLFVLKHKLNNFLKVQTQKLLLSLAVEIMSFYQVMQFPWISFSLNITILGLQTLRSNQHFAHNLDWSITAATASSENEWDDQKISTISLGSLK